MSQPRHRDPLRAMEAADREPELLREERRLQREHQRVALRREAIRNVARAEGRAAMLPGQTDRLEAMFATLDEAREKSRAVLTYVNEMARLLEFRRRLAREAGLLG